MAKRNKNIFGQAIHEKKRRVVSRTRKRELIERGSFTEEKDFERLGFSILKISYPTYREYIEILYNNGEKVIESVRI